ncbi:HNH endonuclease [Mycolicibacterium sp. Y3]
MGDFLPGDRSWWSVARWWQVSFALIVTVALTVGGVHWLSDRDRPGAGAGSVSLAQGFADAALAAFSGSTTVAVAAEPALSPGQRAAGLPTDPVAGLTSNTAAGPVQVVLPGGLGAAQHTSGGQVVYPDTGAGFDMLAENTATGTRTVARINTAAGVRMVTTFVRTPADTVMLAHTNGYLTINRATPTAETVGMFAPAETRDATGRLVPASYVVKKVAPQLYALAEVIDPRPDTAWPVYVDPPLHVGGVGGAPLPTGLFDSITSTISSAASAVGDAVTTAASATVAGATAVGTFVKNNPLQSAVLVGGVALALTGVGGPAGAAMIASSAVNLASAGVDIAAAAMPDNQALGTWSTVLGVASMVTPQGAAKAAVKEVAEKATEELATHADDLANTARKVIDTATEAPTPPTQLANDIAGAPAAAKPPLPGVDTPKAPNAPPGPDLPVPGVAPKPTGGTISPKVKDLVTEDRVARNPDRNLYCENPACGQRVYRQEGTLETGDKIPPNRAQFDHDQTPKSAGGTGGKNGEDTKILCIGCNGPAGKSAKTPEEWAAAQEEAGRRSTRNIQRFIRENGGEPADGVIRSPNIRPQAAERNEQAQQQARSRADQHRDNAIDQARQSNGDGTTSHAGDNASGKKSGQKKKPKKKKSKVNHPRPK